MSNSFSGNRPARVLFFGMPGMFSATVLQMILQAEIEVAAVVLAISPPPGQKHRGPAIRSRQPGRRLRATLPILSQAEQPSLNDLITEHALTTWEVLRFSDPETVETLARYQADLICVACFSARVPQAILKLPRLGGLNVHPSLLPRHRGPVPLFWTFREGVRRTGVTIHMLEERLDSGDILAQEAFDLPDGISYAALDQRCAHLGGQLLTRVIGEMQQGRERRLPQDESQSSYEIFPTDADFNLPLAEVDARHAYNFATGLIGWDQPPGLQSRSRLIRIQRAISYSLEKPARMPVEVEASLEEWQTAEGTLWLRCHTGWIEVVEV